MTELVIRPVDSANPADVDAFLAVYAAAEHAADPEARLPTPADTVTMLGTHDTSFFLDGHAALLGGTVRGISTTYGGLRDNLGLVQVQVLVHPQHRRQGIGSALATHAEERASRQGRWVVRTQVRTGPAHSGNERFAESRGYRKILTEVERRLPLPVDADTLDRVADEAARHHDGYDVRVVVGAFPPALRHSYVTLRNLLLAEMPHGDGADLEASRETVDDYVADEHKSVAAGRTRVTAYAVRGDEVVAYSEASVPAAGTTHVDQIGTLVHPAHRGRRLGTAVKCAQLRALSQGFPDRAYVGTSNAEVNDHMVAINAALGFEVHQVWAELEKRLDPAKPEMG